MAYARVREDGKGVRRGAWVNPTAAAEEESTTPAAKSLYVSEDLDMVGHASLQGEVPQEL